MDQHSSTPLQRSGVRWRQAIPTILALVGAVLLIGCIYLPIPEHKVGPEKDFRNLMGDSQSNKPIRPGAITRSQVMAMLGKPALISADGRRLGYAIETHRGIGIWPLCFSAGAYTQYGYAVRLEFDEQGNLVDYALRKANIEPGGLHLFQDVKGIALYEFEDDPEFHSLSVLNPTTRP